MILPLPGVSNTSNSAAEEGRVCGASTGSGAVRRVVPSLRNEMYHEALLLHDHVKMIAETNMQIPLVRMIVCSAPHPCPSRDGCLGAEIVLAAGHGHLHFRYYFPTFTPFFWQPHTSGGAQRFGLQQGGIPRAGVAVFPFLFFFAVSLQVFLQSFF